MENLTVEELKNLVAKVNAGVDINSFTNKSVGKDILNSDVAVEKSTKGKFFFKNKRVLLTYKTHLPKEEYIEWFKNRTGRHDIWIRIAHESGDEKCPYEHSHVLIDFIDKVFQVKGDGAERYFDYEGIHPNIKFVRYQKHWDLAVPYLGKEDPENADLLEYKPHKSEKAPIVTEVWESPNLQSALKNTPIRYATNVIAVWNNRPEDTIENEFSENFKLWPWQKQIHDELFLPPNDRTIVWIYDEKGLGGKTTLLDYMCYKYPKKCNFFKSLGGDNNVAMNVKNLLDKGWNGDTFLINLTRDYEDRRSIYSALEMLKEKRITCTKFAGGNIIKKICHVIVLANFLPDTSKLSADRWDIRDLANFQAWDWRSRSEKAGGIIGPFPYEPIGKIND